MPSTPRKRKSAVTQNGKQIKTSVVIDNDLFSRWAAASALKGVSRNAYLASALEIATKSIVLFDRSAKRSDPVEITESALLAIQASESEDEAA